MGRTNLKGTSDRNGIQINMSGGVGGGERGKTKAGEGHVQKKRGREHDPILRGNYIFTPHPHQTISGGRDDRTGAKPGSTSTVVKGNKIKSTRGFYTKKGDTKGRRTKKEGKRARALLRSKSSLVKKEGGPKAAQGGIEEEGDGGAPLHRPFISKTRGGRRKMCRKKKGTAGAIEITGDDGQGYGMLEKTTSHDRPWRKTRGGTKKQKLTTLKSKFSTQSYSKK